MDNHEAMAGCRDRTLQGGDLDLNERSRWEKATIAFTLLKAKIAITRFSSTSAQINFR